MKNILQQWKATFEEQSKYLTLLTVRFLDPKEELTFKIQRFQTQVDVLKFLSMVIFLKLFVDWIPLVISSQPWHAYLCVYSFGIFWSVSSYLILTYLKFTPFRIYLMNAYMIVSTYICIEFIFVRYGIYHSSIVIPIIIFAFQLIFFFMSNWLVEAPLFAVMVIVHTLLSNYNPLTNIMIFIYYAMVSYFLSRVRRTFFHKEYSQNIQVQDFINLINKHIDLGIWIVEEASLAIKYENSKGKQIVENSDYSCIKELLTEKNLKLLENEEKSNKTIDLKSQKLSTQYFFSSINRYIYLGISCILIVFNDVTPSKIMELEMLQISEDKNNVIAAVSHDIRTPLNSSISMNELALKEVTDPKTKYKLEISLKSSKLLLFFITDFLDFSKLDKMKLGTNNSRFYLKNVVKETTELFYPIVRARGLEFYLEVYVDPNIELNTDEPKLKRILINLFSNAMKYTLRGYISLRITAIRIDRECFLEFSVIDTGIGISSENMSKIFEKFGQVYDEKRNKGVVFGHGIGLGLTISNEMIKSINPYEKINKIFLDSKFNEGSVFSFYLPFVPSKKCYVSSFKWEAPKYKQNNIEAMKKTTQIYMQKNFDKCFFEFINETDFGLIEEPLTIPISQFDKGIMVVEDEETNIMVLKMYLKEVSFKVAYLRNGKEAIDFFQRVCEGKIQISKIFMDLNMPVMNGKEAAVRIREMERNFERTKIKMIALTANTIEVEEEKEMNSYGFDNCEMKPISKEKFMNY